MKRWLALLLLVLTAGLSVGCNGTDPEGFDIYVTVYPIEYLVDSLLQGTEITCGVVPGVSSHQESIDWSPKQIIAMTNAKYLFFVGANLDIYIDNQVNGVFSGKPVTLVKLETALPDLLIPGTVDHDHEEPTEPLAEEEENHLLGWDPHFWISPLRMIQLVDLLEAKLSDSANGYPDLADEISANKITLLAKLNELNTQYDLVLDRVDAHAVMTSTNLYGYLEHDYGLKNYPVSPGYHEEADQFTTQQKELAVQQALEHEIRYIIYEKNASSPLSNAVFDALSQTSPEWDPLKLEFNIMHSFAMSDRVDGEGNVRDYYTVMLENLQVLRTATGYTE
ncbi:MAG TPA: zinc ABC transporter substrate-binding protein [Candidatus Izemoplasmatales bacterium]|nr:zinc ABC transporter substrate-binding protein [Bacillota bacterium]HRY77446.1 zinc ABC transporter substrate-binding protein [Candidatus Izemoplasmatales bacterium]